MSRRRKRLPTTVRFAVLERDGHRCQYCGVAQSDAELTVDHVVPISAGGTDDPSNLVTACADCNRGKSDSPIGQAKITSLYGPTWDKSQQRWDLRWKEDGVSKSFVSADRDEAATKRAELVGAPEKVCLPRLEHFATAEDIRDGLEAAALALNHAASIGSSESVLLLRKYAAGLSEIGSAIVPHAGYVELEEAHAELLAYVEALHADRELDNAERPAAIARPASTLKSSNRPGAKPHRSRDPLQN